MTELALSVAGVRRPARADAARNFDAVLEAARAAFARHGSAASLEDIARNAGVGIATLYRNFPTREHLFNSVYVEEVRQLCAVAAEVSDLDPWLALTRWLRRLVEFDVVKQAIKDGLDRNSAVSHAGRDALLAVAEPLLGRAIDAGVARDDVTVSDVARLIVGISRSNFEDNTQFERVLGIAMDGLRPQSRGQHRPSGDTRNKPRTTG